MSPELQQLIASKNRQNAKNRQRVVVNKITDAQLLARAVDAIEQHLLALNGKGGDIDVTAHDLRDVMSIARARQRRSESSALSGSRSAVAGRA